MICQIYFANIDISLHNIMMKTKTQFYELIHIIKKVNTYLVENCFRYTLNVIYKMKFLVKITIFFIFSQNCLMIKQLKSIKISTNSTFST